MIGLLQRVREARVEVGGRAVGAIGRGILVLVGVQRGDDPSRADRLARRLLDYRVFPDAERRMNLSVRDVSGGVLLVPQFTLAADTRKGNRASFTSAAPPEEGRVLFEHLTRRCRSAHAPVESGEFGANMQVHLVNDGPVTFWLEG
jgi:D-tyrosyl-tRNA(Tyr) deacylase